MFITFEGPEGGGKTTQIARLAKKLRDGRESVVVTRQPGGEELGQRLRSLLLDKQTFQIEPMAELMMMMADRAQSVARIIKPALESGAVVISDRYADSSVAYQGAGRNIPIETIHQLNDIATGGLYPDITFLLDLEPELGLNRQAEKTRMEGESLDFHKRVREQYLILSNQFSNRIKVIDASQSFDQVERDIWTHYEAHHRHRA